MPDPPKKPSRVAKVVFTPTERALIEQFRPQGPPPEPTLGEMLIQEWPKVERPGQYRPMPRVPSELGDLPIPPHPGIFQKEPIMQGSGQLSAAWQALAKAFPWLTDQPNTTRITQGPTRDVADEFAQSNMHYGSGLDIEDFPRTTLRGLRNEETGDITLNPSLSDARLPKTLAHELLHGKEHTHGTIDPLEQQWRDIEERVRRAQIEMLTKKPGGR